MTKSPPLLIRDFENVVFFTGAGMSAESGVPTYRGAGGIWKTYDHTTCACEEAFRYDPDHVWEFHNFRRELVSKCAPNAGHEIVASAEHAVSNVTVITQNIDGLHQLAGSTVVHELHGSLWEERCDGCGWRGGGRVAPLVDLKCPDCARHKRPNIVWFGDQLFIDVIQSAQQALRHCDLLVAIGTSAVVYPAAQLPLLAREAGAVLVEVNPEDTPMSHAYDHHLRGSATQMLAWIGDDLC